MWFVLRCVGSALDTVAHGAHATNEAGSVGSGAHGTRQYLHLRGQLVVGDGFVEAGDVMGIRLDGEDSEFTRVTAGGGEGEQAPVGAYVNEQVGRA